MGDALRVLIVEDDIPLATIVAAHLRARGHETRIVESVDEAEKAIAGGLRPTIVLLDINLPGTSGWALLRSGILGRVGDPPVYVVSATAIAPSRLRGLGAAGFLPKPFAMPTLLEIVERGATPVDDEPASALDLS